MVPVDAKIDSKIENSCNWKCCFGNKKESPRTPAPSPIQQQMAQKAENVFKEAQDQARHYESMDGSLDLEFDAVHVKIKKTPDSTPGHTPRRDT